MSLKLHRRQFLQGAAGVLAFGATGTLPLRPASADTGLTVVDWGTPYMPATQAMGERFGKGAITWALHEGGGAAMLAKIKAAWPNTDYDLVDQWTATYPAFIREGWAETVTAADIPNLADVPEALIAKDEAGNWKSVPRSLNGFFFAYNAATCPIEIKSLQDLFDPALRGQICWPSPVMNNSLQVVALSLANGGDEHNIEPGFEALVELAGTGNIGRIYTVLSEAVASMTSGETSVIFSDQGTLSSVQAAAPLTFLTKTDPSLKTFLATEGWVIMSNSKNKELAFELANFSISPSECEAFNQAVGLNPTNVKSKPTPGLDHLSFTNDELATYAYVPDFDYLSQQLDGWTKRFEQDVAPLLR